MLWSSSLAAWWTFAVAAHSGGVLWRGEEVGPGSQAQEIRRFFRSRRDLSSESAVVEASARKRETPKLRRIGRRGASLSGTVWRGNSTGAENVVGREAITKRGLDP